MEGRFIISLIAILVFYHNMVHCRSIEKGSVSGIIIPRAYEVIDKNAGKTFQDRGAKGPRDIIIKEGKVSIAKETQEKESM